MIKVYGRASSSNVQCVMWCAAELDLPVERLDAGLMYGVNTTPDYLAMNPNGTIPTLIDGDAPPLWESGAIVRYMANRYGNEQFWPSDPIARANIDRWAEWGKVSVQIDFNASIFWPVLRQSKDTESLNKAITNFEDKLRIAQEQLNHYTYIAGDQLTLADVQFGHILFRYYEIEIERAELPLIHRYYDQLTSLPNYQKHVMVNFDELRPNT